jgi:hypothetical protein
MCSGKVRLARVRGEEIVAVKVERLPVYSIEGVWAGTGQDNGQRRWDSIWILDSRVGDTSMRKLYGEEIWRLQGWPSELLRELEGGGTSTKDCGRLAASEFQQCMADAVMGSVVMRLKFRREMQELEGVVRTLPWLIPEAPKAQSGRVSLLIVRFPEKRGESPQILCCKGREGSWMVGGEVPAGRGAGEGCLVVARGWAAQLVTRVSEPFQHSRDTSRDRTDVVCLVPHSAELMAGHETLYTWETLEELGLGCVFLLAANAVNLALSFMGRWVTTQGGGRRARLGVRRGGGTMGRRARANSVYGTTVREVAGRASG